MASPNDIYTLMAECERFWKEFVDLQNRFVNEVVDLHKLQGARPLFVKFFFQCRFPVAIQNDAHRPGLVEAYNVQRQTANGVYTTLVPKREVIK